MPANSSIDFIAETLRSSLGSEKRQNLEDRLVSSSKKALLTKIEFKQGQKDCTFQLSSLRSKYIPLNPSHTQPQQSSNNGNTALRDHSNMNGESSQPHGDGIPAPKLNLYPSDRVQLKWKGSSDIGCGLTNMGNTCFMNSTLQCLAYTPPLHNYLQSDEHQRNCKNSGFCVLCELSRHVKRCFSQPRHASIKPMCIIQRLQSIARHMKYGRQEDAHEFLRYMLDGCQKSCLIGYQKLDKYSKDTTVINRIFGGYLRSQVKCLRCKQSSDTFDPFLDLNLDIKNANSIQEALGKYIQPEMLEGENAYQCTHCKAKTAARKQFTIHRSPNILTIQLKRFDAHRMGQKISRPVDFPEWLDIRPYMSARKGEEIRYQLYAVLVHSGFSCTSGHYYSFVRSKHDHWFCMNDSSVQATKTSHVLNAQAYLLFYMRKSKAAVLTKPPLIGPQLPNNFLPNNVHKNAQVSKELGSPVNRTQKIFLNAKKPVATVVPNNSKITTGFNATYKQSTAMKPRVLNMPSTIPHVTQREKISFGIKQKDVPESADTEKAGLVLKIMKNGKNQYESFVKESPEKLNGATKNGLVPYGQDSGSDEENQARVANMKKDSPSIKSPKRNLFGSPPQERVVFDKTLNATTSVPGLSLPLSKAAEKDKFDSSSHRKEPKSPGVLSPPKLSVNTDQKPVQEPKTPLSVIKERGKITKGWQIHEPDVTHLLSPVVSECSNTSINSTTEWHILDLNDPPPTPTLAESQHSGWTVSPAKKNPSSPRIVLKKTSSDSSIHHRDDKALNERLGQKKQELSTITESASSTMPLLLPNHKTKKKDRSKEDEDSGFVSRQNSDDDRDSDDKDRLVIDIPSDRKKHKKHKKNKKHKRAHDEGIDVDGNTNEERSHKKKKKKKHKKKHRHDDREHIIDNETPKDQPPKKRRRESLETSPNDSSVSKKKHHSDENDKCEGHNETLSDVEAVWVEKTIDTIEKDRLNHKSEEKTSKLKTEVIAQDWDQHSKKHAKSTPCKPSAKWDGNKHAAKDVVGELIRGSSSRGYGASVSSWGGGKSNLDEEVKRDKAEERKRRWEDNYEEDLDKGKTKKVHKERKDFSNYGNIFQRMHEFKNKSKDTNHSDYHKQSSHSLNHSYSHYSEYKNDRGSASDNWHSSSSKIHERRHSGGSSSSSRHSRHSSPTRSHDRSHSRHSSPTKSHDRSHDYKDSDHGYNRDDRYGSKY